MKATSLTRRHGFTLIELLVVIAIIAILSGVTMPVASKIKEGGLKAGCTSNLRQIYTAVAAYAQDNDGWLPPKYEVKKSSLKADDLKKGKKLNTPTDGIQTVLAAYAPANTFQCPADRGDGADPKPVHERKGVSYDIKGADLNQMENEPDKARLNGSAVRDLAMDLFKPWDAADAKKASEAKTKGELAPTRWHARFHNKVMSDGHIVTVSSKEEDKLSKGEESD